jgi:hypothetical protein
VSSQYASQYKGVGFDPRKRAKPWLAQIKIEGKTRYLGMFATEEEAHAARQSAAEAVGRKSQRWVSRVAIYEDDRDWVEIELTKGKWAKVDLADLDKVIGLAWHYNGHGYAMKRGGCSWIGMHRRILGLPPGKYPEVDHINHDRLDNRRSNLRLANRDQQMHNRKPNGTSKSSRFKGVSWNKARQRWVASITANGRRRYLGSFDIEEDAARAYNEAAIEMWGEFAYPNPV